MYKVHGIRTVSFEALVKKINCWLEENPNIEIIDIKQNDSQSESHSEYTALIVYKETLKEGEVEDKWKRFVL